jgi:hypothetical protein
MLPVSLDCFSSSCVPYPMLPVSLDCFSSSCVPYPMLPVSLDCAFLMGPSVFHLFLLIYIYTFCILTKHHFYKELLNIHRYPIHNEFL